MATFTWIDGSDFNTADWELTSGTSSGTIPGPYDTANISGTSAAPVTVTVSSADEDAVNQINLTDATLAETGGSMTVGTLTTTNNDTLTSQLYALSISAGELTIQYGSTIGDTNPEVVGLEQTGGTVQFENDQGFNQNSYLVGGLSAVNQLQGTIEVDQGFLHIQGNSNFGGTLAGSAGSAENSGTIIFDAPTTYTFTNGAKVTVGQLEIGSGGTTTVILGTNLTYAGIFNVINNTVFYLNDTLTLTGKGNTLGGDITGGGTLVIARGAKAANNPNNGGFGIGGTATLDNKGTLTLGGTGGGASIFIGDSTTSTAELLNDTTGKLTVTGGQQFVGQYKGELVNDGQMTVAGAGTVNVGADFWNFGTTTVESGSRLQLAGDVQGGAVLGGTINGGGSVVLDDGNVYQTYQLEAGLSLSGVSLNMEYGSLVLDASIDLGSGLNTGNGSNIDLDGYTLTLGASPSFQYPANVSGPGTLEIATGAVAEIEGTEFNGGAVLAVQGMVWSDSGFTLNSATLQIQAGGVVDLTGNQGIANGGIGSSISNAGTLELTGGSGSPVLVGVQYSQSAGGAVLANSSGPGLEFNSNDDSFTGAIDGSGIIQLSGGNSGYNYTFAGGTTIGVANLEVTNSADLLIAASLTDGGALSLSYGSFITLGQNVEFTVTGSTSSLAGEVQGSGTLDIATGATTDIEGASFSSGAVLAVQGKVNSLSGFTLGTTASSGTLQILAGGAVNLEGNNGIGGSTLSSISNAGTLELTGGTNPAVIGVQYTQLAGGEAWAEYAGTTLEFDGKGDTFAGAIDGSGTVELSGGNTYTFASGTTISVANLEVNSATLAINANLTDGGGLTLSNGTVNFSDDVDTIAGAVSGTGNFGLSNGSTLTFSAGVSSGETVTFGSGAADLLNLKLAQSFDATIEDFSTVGDAVDLTTFGHSASTFLYTQTGTDSASWTVTDGSEQAVINFAGEPYTQSDFQIVSANKGAGSEIKFVG